MWKRLVVILSVLCLGLMPAGVLAATSQEVTVTARPAYGIISFSIDYTSDTQMDLSWTASAEVVNVMVRAKYGSDLAEIPDEDTAPSDGYLVYEGAGSSISDVSMDFDANPGPLYYKLWGQKADDKWYTGSYSAFEESAVVTLLGMLLFAFILSYLAFKSSFKPMRFVAGFSWVAVLIFWIMSPPSAITAGSAAHVAVMLVLIFAAFVVSVSGFGEEENRQRNTPGASKSSSVFNLRKPSFLVSEQENRAAIQRKREEDNAEYRARVHRATHQRGNK